MLESAPELRGEPSASSRRRGLARPRELAGKRCSEAWEAGATCRKKELLQKKKQAFNTHYFPEQHPNTPQQDQASRAFLPLPLSLPAASQGPEATW